MSTMLLFKECSLVSGRYSSLKVDSEQQCFDIQVKCRSLFVVEAPLWLRKLSNTGHT